VFEEKSVSTFIGVVNMEAWMQYWVTKNALRGNMFFLYVMDKKYRRLQYISKASMSSVRVDTLISSTQKLKLMRENRQSTYTLQHPRSRAAREKGANTAKEKGANVNIMSGGTNKASARIWTRDLCLWYHVTLTSSTQKLKLMKEGGQSTYTLQQVPQGKTT
jgi:hypothetical protein